MTTLTNTQIADILNINPLAVASADAERRRILNKAAVQQQKLADQLSYNTINTTGWEMADVRFAWASAYAAAIRTGEIDIALPCPLHLATAYDVAPGMLGDSYADYIVHPTDMGVQDICMSLTDVVPPSCPDHQRQLDALDGYHNALLAADLDMESMDEEELAEIYDVPACPAIEDFITNKIDCDWAGRIPASRSDLETAASTMEGHKLVLDRLLKKHAVQAGAGLLIAAGTITMITSAGPGALALGCLAAPFIASGLV